MSGDFITTCVKGGKYEETIISNYSGINSRAHVCLRGRIYSMCPGVNIR